MKTMQLKTINAGQVFYFGDAGLKYGVNTLTAYRRTKCGVRNLVTRRFTAMPSVTGVPVDEAAAIIEADKKKMLTDFLAAVDLPNPINPFVEYTQNGWKLIVVHANLDDWFAHVTAPNGGLDFTSFRMTSDMKFADRCEAVAALVQSRDGNYHSVPVLA